MGKAESCHNRRICLPACYFRLHSSKIDALGGHVMNLILGIPIKIFKGDLIYIQKSFWLQYGINPEHDRVIRVEAADRITFRRFQPGLLQGNEKALHVYLRSIHILPAWMARNSLKIGDTVWLIGTEGGLTIMAHQSLEKVE
jgi:hypothetical protein